MNGHGACYQDAAESISTGLIEWLQSCQASTLLIGGFSMASYLPATAVQLCRQPQWNVIVNLAACIFSSEHEKSAAIRQLEDAGATIIQSLNSSDYLPLQQSSSHIPSTERSANENE